MNKEETKEFERRLFESFTNLSEEEIAEFDRKEKERKKVIEAMEAREPFYWVTDETRQFMEKGYLDPGQTVEERVWRSLSTQITF